MRINADFSQPIVIRPGDVSWVPSPAPGVERQMLDRIGDEVARATSIVRYAAGSSFPEHVHGGGEEFLVLEGVFSDETGDFHAGTYVRNPIGTAHSPHTNPGCTIFVKLHQFDPADDRQIVRDSLKADWCAGPAAGVSVLPLHRFGDEQVEMIVLAAGARLPDQTYPGGAEILVVDGTVQDADGTYPAGSWLRLPPGARQTISSPSSARVWRKQGHLHHILNGRHRPDG